MAEGQNVCSENKEIRETMRQMRVVNKGIRKVDAKALVTGRAVYTNDIASSDSLIVKLVRSPHAHALIKEINTTRQKIIRSSFIRKKTGEVFVLSERITNVICVLMT